MNETCAYYLQKLCLFFMKVAHVFFESCTCFSGKLYMLFLEVCLFLKPLKINKKKCAFVNVMIFRELHKNVWGIDTILHAVGIFFPPPAQAFRPVHRNSGFHHYFKTSSKKSNIYFRIISGTTVFPLPRLCKQPSLSGFMDII